MTTATAIQVNRSTHAADNGFGPRAGFALLGDQPATESIIDCFLRVASRQPDATAIVDGSTRLTYRQLLSQANAFRQGIDDQFNQRPGPIGLRVAFSADAIVSIIGVLRSGRPYLFLPSVSDPVLPDVLQATALAGIVTDDPHAMSATATTIPVIPRNALLVDRAFDAPAAVAATTACLFATSGTTGAPKIVSVPQRLVVADIARQVRDLFLGPDDRIDLLFDPAFSASLSSIFSALLTGAELHLRTPTADALMLGQWLADSRITISTMTVSSFRTVAATIDPARPLSDLRLLSIGGETVRPADVQAFLRAFPATCVLQNAMASTETRTYAQFFVTHRHVPDGPVPIGWPVDGKLVTVVDPSGEPVPAGDEGEIVVRSRDLADGYANDAALTARRFRRHADGSVSFATGDRGRFREDGCLLFLGRMDTLVKIRGHRVDMAAVESAFRDEASIVDAAVVTRTIAGEPVLVAFVVFRDQAATDLGMLRQSLAQRLTAAAVPHEIRALRALPVNRNGKTDYQTLRRMAKTHSAPDLPAGDMLTAVRSAWAFSLDRKYADAAADFFAMGGDSLRAARLQLALFERTGHEVPYAVLVTHPTPRQLTDWLSHRAPHNPGHPAIVPLSREGPRTPLFCVPGIGGEPLSFSDLSEKLKGVRPIYGLAATNVLEPRGATLTVEQIAASYVEAVSAVLSPDDPVLLCGHSFGAIVGHEMTRQFAAAGRRVAVFAVIDTPLSRQRGGLLGRVADISRNLPGWIRYDLLEADPSSMIARVRGKVADGWDAALASLKLRARSRYPDFRAYFGKRAVPVEVVERMHARLDALHRYGYPRSDATVVLFRCHGQALSGRSDRALGWDALAGRVEVHDVPGHHDSCAHRPHVDLLSMSLASVLDRAGV